MAKKPVGSIEDAIRPVGKLMSKPRSWCIYGRSGTGKTTLAATFPKPILLLDVRDEGTDSVSDVKDLDVLEIEEWDDFEEIYWMLQDKEQKKKYKTLVIDTVTQAQQLCLEHIMTKKRRDKSRAGDWGSLSRREWGDASAMMKKMIMDFRDLPLEVVFLSQQRVTGSDEDEEDEALLMPEVGPSAMKSVADHLAAAVSVIGQTFTRIKQSVKEVKGKKVRSQSVQYHLRLAAHPVYLTKMRKPKSIKPPESLIDPTYDELVEIIKGE